jgi:hypothetical protein
MTLQDQVCSLELAKKLKELGVEHKTLFYIDEQDSEITFGNFVTPTFTGHTYISAFTVAELFDLLPKEYSLRNGVHGFTLSHTTGMFRRIPGKTAGNSAADCCAKMLVYLLENNIIKPNA